MKNLRLAKLVIDARMKVGAAYHDKARRDRDLRYDLLADVRDVMRYLVHGPDADRAPMLAARAAEVVRIIDLIEEWRLLELSNAAITGKSAEEQRLIDLLSQMSRIANGLSPDRESARDDLAARRLAA